MGLGKRSFSDVVGSEVTQQWVELRVVAGEPVEPASAERSLKKSGSEGKIKIGKCLSNV